MLYCTYIRTYVRTGGTTIQVDANGNGDASEEVRGLVLYADVSYRDAETRVEHVPYAALVSSGHALNVPCIVAPPVRAYTLRR